mgnify:FL=1
MPSPTTHPIARAGLKYLLNCNSVVISHQLHWDQHFHPAFDSNPVSPLPSIALSCDADVGPCVTQNSPNQNIVILQGNDWDELPATMDFLEKNPERAKLIAANARRSFHGRCVTRIVFCLS